MRLFRSLILALAVLRRALQPRLRVYGDSLDDYIDVMRPVYPIPTLAQPIGMLDPAGLRRPPRLVDYEPMLSAAVRWPARPLGIDIRSPRPGAVIRHRLFLAPPLGVHPELN